MPRYAFRHQDVDRGPLCVHLFLRDRHRSRNRHSSRRDRSVWFDASKPPCHHPAGPGHRHVALRRLLWSFGEGKTVRNKRNISGSEVSFNFALILRSGLKTVWPVLLKFHHFAKKLQVFGKFLMVYFLFGKILSRWVYFSKFVTLFGIFHCRKWPNIEK